MVRVQVPQPYETREIRGFFAFLANAGNGSTAAWTHSGGEAIATALAGVTLRRAPITLLDEPTNNLDLRSVGQLVEALAAYRGALLVVSHERDFLRRVGVQRELRLLLGRVLAEVDRWRSAPAPNADEEGVLAGVPV